VIHVMSVLGMMHIRDHLVGDAQRRGISGGQKKRVNIGVELAAMPAILFMDEPTSGLDGAATIELARCLGQLRLSGLTIICVIHQPRFAVYDMFTHLLLLGKGGNQVFCGRAELIEQYLTEAGFRLPAKENPADWLIDVVCGLAPRYDTSGKEDKDFTAPQDLFAIWESGCKDQVFDESFQWSKDFVAPEALRGIPLEPLTQRRTPNRLQQMYYMLKRSISQHEMGVTMAVCSILFGSAACFAYINTERVSYSYLFLEQWVTGYGAASPLFSLFVASYTRPLFTKERLIYQREQKSGVSSLSYFIARNLYNLALLPLLSAAYSLGLFFFAMPAQEYDTYFLAAFCAAFYWSGAAMMVSMLVDSELISTLALIFWPLLEPILAGSFMFMSTPRDSPLSWLTCGRWNIQILFCAEVSVLPYNVLSMPESNIKGQLQDRLVEFPKGLLSAARTADAWEADDMSTLDPLKKDFEDAMAVGINSAVMALLLAGLAFRTVALLLMVLGKYSQGGGFLHQIVYVINRAAGRPGSAVSVAVDRDAFHHDLENTKNFAKTIVALRAVKAMKTKVLFKKAMKTSAQPSQQREYGRLV